MTTRCAAGSGTPRCLSPIAADTRAARRCPQAQPHARALLPGAAANDATIAVRGRPGRAIGIGVPIVLVIAILDPLRDIAMHVVKAEAIRLLLADRVRTALGVDFEPCVLIKLAVVVSE